MRMSQEKDVRAIRLMLTIAGIVVGLLLVVHSMGH
jgi:hypothetical protein